MTRAAARTSSPRDPGRAGRPLPGRGIGRDAPADATGNRLEDLEAFVGAVAHDLRAPLINVSSYARILEEEHSAHLGPEASGCVAAIRRVAQDMEEVIANLLNLSRAGSEPLETARVDSRRLVEGVLQSLGYRPGGRVRVSIARLHDCIGHAGLLRQVWTNLLSNALKFSRESDPAVITIGSFASGATVTCFVRDNGVGFDMDRAGELFLPFRRLHDGRYEGQGMGLNIVRRIVSRHDGSLRATSRPGQGATFYFTLAAPRALRH